MKRNIWAIWAAGALLAVILIVIGPAGLGSAIRSGIDALRAALFTLGPAAVAVLRALAIALLLVFVGLCALAGRLGLPTGRVVFTVGIVFVLLVAFPQGETDQGGLRWSGAFALALVASLVMTARLLRQRDATARSSTSSSEDHRFTD